MNDLEKCSRLLMYNGWVFDKYNTPEKNNSEYYSYHKENFVSIDMNKDEIVLIDDSGDFLHLLCNYYTLVGALIVNRQLPINFKLV